MMVWKMAIRCAVQFGYIAPEFAKELWRYQGSRTVAGVGNATYRSIEFDVFLHPFDVTRNHIGLLAHASFAFCKVAGLNDPKDVLDLLTVDCLPSDAQFKSVVLGGIVARGDHDPAFDRQFKEGKVQEGSWQRSNVDKVASGLSQSFGHQLIESIGCKTHIAAKSQNFAAMLSSIGAEAASDCKNRFFG